MIWTDVDVARVRCDWEDPLQAVLDDPSLCCRLHWRWMLALSICCGWQHRRRWLFRTGHCITRALAASWLCGVGITAGWLTESDSWHRSINQSNKPREHIYFCFMTNLDLLWRMLTFNWNISNFSQTEKIRCRLCIHESPNYFTYGDFVFWLAATGTV